MPALVLLSLGAVRCSSGESVKDDDLGDNEHLTALPREDIDLSLPAPDDDALSSDNLNPYCGSGSCIPDNGDGCDMGAGGAGGASSEDEMEPIGAAGGVPYDPGDLAGGGTSCQVGPDPECTDDACKVIRRCEQSGSSLKEEPCVTTRDCAPGLACVGEGVSGLCRPYCCAGTATSCDEGTFCDERPLPDSPDIFVPVCVPVDNCPLSDPYPCPEGQECACSESRACVVVRSDGATACTIPGPGQTGDPCTGRETAECAHGFVCSPEAGCMKLCSTVAEDSGCPSGGTCQAPSEFGSDLGVCVGSSSGPAAAK